jgi:hypothetical protein
MAGSGRNGRSRAGHKCLELVVCCRNFCDLAVDRPQSRMTASGATGYPRSGPGGRNGPFRTEQHSRLLIASWRLQAIPCMD